MPPPPPALCVKAHCCQLLLEPLLHELHAALAAGQWSTARNGVLSALRSYQVARVGSRGGGEWELVNVIKLA